MFRMIALALALAACDAGTADATPAVDARVTRAAAVAKDVAAGTASADALAKHGLTAGELEALMLEIAADPALSAAYEEARK